jgi:hypothetical protein
MSELEQAKEEFEAAQAKYRQMKRAVYLDGNDFLDDLRNVFIAAGVKWDEDADLEVQMEALRAQVKKTAQDLTATYYPRNGVC